MKPKAASLTKTQKERREAKLFKWHMRSPVHERYDHEHWWITWQKENKTVPQAAMVWEIFRRHPDTYASFTLNRRGLALLHVTAKTGDLDFGDALAVARLPQAREYLILAAHCFDSWPNLPNPVQRMWRQYFHDRLTPQHGCQPSAVVVLNDYRATAILKSSLAKSDAQKRRAYQRHIATLAMSQPDDFLCGCKDYDATGRIIIAIDPSAPIHRIESTVKAAVAAWPRRAELRDNSKNRVENCLAIIAEFEQEKAGPKKLKRIALEEPFVRYRRIIRAWFFPS